MGTALEDVKVGRQFDTWLRSELEDTVPCVWPDCETEAEYRMTMPCCNKGVELCETHAQVQRDFLAVVKVFRCSLCGAGPVDAGGIVLVKI